MRQRNRRRGFTLVEVLVALAILGIGILGVTTLFPRALEQGRRAAALTHAANFADQEFSRYRAKGFQGMFGTPKPRHPLNLSAYDALSAASDAYAVYGFDKLPVRLVRTEILHFGRASGLYKVCVLVPLMAGGDASFVTYLARE